MENKYVNVVLDQLVGGQGFAYDDNDGGIAYLRNGPDDLVTVQAHRGHVFVEGPSASKAKGIIDAAVLAGAIPPRIVLYRGLKQGPIRLPKIYRNQVSLGPF